MSTTIKLKIKTCMECPFFKQERYYTSDSFENAYNWFCKKKHNKEIAGYVEWHEEEKVPIPDWCPIKTKQT